MKILWLTEKVWSAMMNSNGNVSVYEPNEKIIQNKHNDYDSKEEKIMPLVTSKEMLLKAQKGGYAVGAFNAENMEMVKAIIQAAEELKAPVMIQTTPSTVKYGTVETYAAIVAAEAAKASVPVCLHLDHGSSFELAMQAMHAGYTSVMIDGSKLDFEDNIRETRRVADVAAALDIPCEAELGKVGGKEDDLEAEADTNTDPQEAKEFVERTGVTSLAVAIGTAHGFYVGTPVLDKERLSEIREVVDIPLVLHGASGQHHTHYYSGMLMPSCSHFTYNNLIINSLHDYSKNICSHLCPHTLTIF